MEKSRLTDYEMFLMLKRLERRMESFEDLLTIITRLLVAKGVYTVDEAFKMYGAMNRERAQQENKINLEAEINIEE